MRDRDGLEGLLATLGDGSLTRRQLVGRAGLGFGALTAAGFLAACGSSDKKSSGQIKQGGTATIGAEEDPTS